MGRKVGALRSAIRARNNRVQPAIRLAQLASSGKVGGIRASAPRTGWGLKRRDAEGSFKQLPFSYGV